MVSELSLKASRAAGNQVITWLAFAIGEFAVCRALRRHLGALDSPSSDIEFGAAAAPRKTFNGTPVKIACGKIHGLEFALGAEFGIDQAYVFEKFRPVDLGDHAHAGNDVAHGHIQRALQTQPVLNDQTCG